MVRIAIHLNSGPLVITLLQGIRRDQVARHRVLHDAPIKTRMRPHDVIENCALFYDVVLDVANEERNDVLLVDLHSVQTLVRLVAHVSAEVKGHSQLFMNMH